MIPTMLLPFNLVKATLNGAIVLLLYKPLSNVLKRTGFIEKKAQNSEAKKGFNTRSIFVTLIAAAVIAGSLCIILLVLK